MSFFTRVVIMLPKHPAKIFTRTFATEFRRKIGRQKEHNIASFPGLGMTTIMASDIESGRDPVAKVSVRILCSLGATEST